MDDIIIAANSDALMSYGKKILSNRFKMKDLGSISWFLGIQFSHEGDKISMNQSHYLTNVLNKYGMELCNPRPTPCELRGTECYTDDKMMNQNTVL